MSVTAMLNNGAKERTFTPRKIDTCLGWHCLTGAEQFGIIFSSIIIFIVLSLAYMYYLGHARISRRRRATTKISGGKQVRKKKTKKKRDDGLTPAVPANHLRPQYPSHQPGIVYQPAVYRIAGAQVPAMQPFSIVGSYPQWPIAAAPPTSLYNPPYDQYPNVATSTAWRTHNTLQLRTAALSPAARGSHPQQPTWRQRLQRVFGLPVGRASTIANSSPPESPQHRSSDLVVSRSYREESPRRGERQKHIGNSARQPVASDAQLLVEGRALQAPGGSPLADNSDASSDGAQSVQTNAATVHSDDFQIATRPHLADPREAKPPNRETGSDLIHPNRQTPSLGQGDSSRGRDYDDTYSIPSVSSIQISTQGPSQASHSPTRLNEANLLSRIQPESASLLRERATKSGTSTSEYPSPNRSKQTIGSNKMKTASKFSVSRESIRSVTDVTGNGSQTHESEFPMTKMSPHDREAARRRWERKQRLTTDKTDPGGDDGPRAPEAVNQVESRHDSGQA